MGKCDSVGQTNMGSKEFFNDSSMYFFGWRSKFLMMKNLVIWKRAEIILESKFLIMEDRM